MSMLIDDAKALADKLKNSEEYRAYTEAKAAAFENPSTAAMLCEFDKLRREAQVRAAAGETDELADHKLQKLGELLQFDAAAAAYLMAEYRLNALMGDVLQVLAEAVGWNLNG